MTDTFKLSEDPQFVDKVRDVVGLYMNPPEHAVGVLNSSCEVSHPTLRGHLG